MMMVLASIQDWMIPRVIFYDPAGVKVRVFSVFFLISLL
jgi:hypothetical protein